MARKQRLLDTLSQYVEYDNQSSFKNRQYRRFVLNKIIDDFYEIRRVPAHWHALTTEHIQRLVKHWRKKGMKDATIMNYLVSLRYFLNKINHEMTGIDNQSLELSKSRKPPKPTIDGEIILEKIQEPIAFLLFSLQIKFGLTLREAMHLTPNIHIDGNTLWVTRELSINHKDRVVPIVTQQQQEILAKLNKITGQNQSLAKQFGVRHTTLAYRFALSAFNLSTRISYRYLYAKARFAELCLQDNKIYSRKRVIQEMGINKTSTVWTTIHE